MMKSMIAALMYMVDERCGPVESGGFLTGSERQRKEEAALEEKYPGINSKLELTSYGGAWEEIGFYNGFRMAAQLMAEAFANPIESRTNL